MNSLGVSRRDLLAVAGGLAAGSVLQQQALAAAEAANNNSADKIKQSVCRWCYNSIEFNKLIESCKSIGYKSIELLGKEDAKTALSAGLQCAVLSPGGPVSINSCYNRVENHDKLTPVMIDHIDFAAEHKIPNVICFSGNRKGMSDEEGLENCAVGLKKIVGHAEKKNVTVIMELLNSKVDHKDYMCDHTAWGAKLVEKVGSPRFKLLYDIYHMQIMEGDVIRTLKQFKDAIGHYHTGGVPGRAEIDDTQELYYPAIIKAIQETGYAGYLGQEYIPKRDKLASLALGYKICDV